MKFRIFLITSVMFIFACATITFGSPQTGGTYSPKSEYERVTQPVAANQESTVQLNDGAQITIPENSLTGDSTVTIERNPSKTASLPPLGNMDLPLSDFYNFQVEGGQLAGPVDLIIPFDESKLPKQNGYLVAMIPMEQGWKYIPVEANGNKINLYTTELGDPLFGWHFICDPGDSKEACEKTRIKIHEDAAICSPDIALSIVPETGTTETK